MESRAPTPKIQAVGIASMLAVVLTWFAREICGLDMPAEVAAAMAGLIATGAGYLKREPARPEPRRAL